MSHDKTRSARHPACYALAVAAVLLIVTGCASGSTGTGGSPASSSSSSATGKALAAAPAGTFAGHKATGTPVTVGLINPEGGAEVSEPTSREAAQAVVQYANVNLGGLGGHPIKLLVCKEQEDPASAASCANEMVQDKVAAVVVTETAEGDVMAPIIQKASIPYVSYLGASSAELTAKDYSYAWTSGFAGLLQGMAKYAALNKVKSFTLYVQDIAAVVIGAKSLGNPAFKAAGVGLDVVSVPVSTPDATPQVAAGLKSHPKAVGIVGNATVCISVLKALATLGNTARRMVNQSCTDPSVFQATGSALNGAKVVTSADSIGNDPDADTYRAIMARYAPGVPLTGPTLAGYQSMFGFIRAAAKVTSPVTATSLNQAIRSAKNVPVPLGDGGTMTCNGKVVPGLPMICSNFVIVETVKGTSLSQPELIK